MQTGSDGRDGPNSLSRDPPLFETLRSVVAQLLDAPSSSLDPEEDLIARGIDSLRIMKLASRLRQEGIEVKFAELLEQPTLARWWELVRARSGGEGEPPAGTPRDDSEPFDLAPLQHAYWVGRADGQALGVGSHFYFEFDGAGVEPARLEKALHSLRRRHGMLRARFLPDGRQQILPGRPQAEVVVHDLRERGAATAGRVLEAVRRRESNRRLDVERGEGLSLHLSLLPGGRTRLHINIDMLVADASSFRILIGELARLYVNPDEALPPIRYSYPRYLAEKSERAAAARERARLYWNARLDRLPGPPQLPLAVHPHNVRDPRVTRRERWLSKAQWQRLDENARAHGLTLSMVLATAYAEVLAAWSAEPCFVLNLPFFDREEIHPDVPSLVGDFTNVILLAVDLSRDRSFAERARALQARFRKDVANAEYSGVDVLRDLRRSGAAAGDAAPVVFTSTLGMGELFSAEVRACFGRLEWMISQTSQVWLDHQVTEHDGGLLLNWDAVDDLFPEGMLDALFGAYSRLLDWLKAPGGDWEKPVPSLLPPAQAEVRRRVNATATPESGRRLHDAFFAQAVEHPERIALLWGVASHVTYAELAARARRVAGLLMAAGVAPGECVGVTLPRGPSQVEAVLGVLAAGAAYVPIGVDQPAQRRAQMCAKAGIRHVLTRKLERDAPEWPRGVAALTMEEAAQAAPIAAPLPGRADSLAYVLFTSGSTGEPKGVMVPHRAAVNTIEDLNARFEIGPEDRALGVSSLEFDLSVYDAFGMLSVGAGLVLVEEEERRDAARWVEHVRRHRVTVWQSVPVLLEMFLVAAAERAAESSLRVALVGGDWVGLDLRSRLAERIPGCRLVALGGTTETAIHSTVFEVGRVPEHWRSIPYGTPLSNVCCRVVDGRGRDRPDWVTGELWIGGRSLADGYRGEPEQTAQRFVRDGGRRWYRTGDLARYWPDGNLEFLGRADFQVKIRGHRIELGEVESALAAAPGVTAAVATVLDPRGGAKLVAAVIGAGGSRSAQPEAVRAFAAGHLPPYMVPDRVVVLDALPLSRNGKIDRRAVAHRLAQAPDGAPEREAPRGPVERAIAALWSDLLGVPLPGRNESFFALGGDSLLATRLMARLRAEGIQGAELRRLFATPRLADFAADLAQGGPRAPTAVLTPDPQRRHEPFPATEVQRAYWVGRSEEFNLGGVGSHWYWEFDGEDVDLARLEEAWNRLVQRHEMMRAVFDEDGRQRILPNVPRYEIPVREAERGDEGSALAAFRAEMSHRMLDVSHWPLFDVCALRYGSNRTRIGFGFDYIVLDALSITIVFAELADLYEDLDAALPPIGISFRDCVLGLRSDPEAVAAARRDWSRRLVDLPPAPRLPIRKDPSRVSRHRFSRRAARIRSTRWRAIKQQARKHDLTGSSVLGAAYAEVLSAWSSGSDLTLNLTVFDRPDVHPDIHRVLGDFTSLLLVPHRPKPGGWVSAARSFQEELSRSLEHRAASAVWVLRELAQRNGAPQASMPVVFTSTLGVADELVRLSMPFGEYAGGLSQTPQVWLDNQVVEYEDELLTNWDAVEELFPEGVLDAMFEAYVSLLDWLGAPGADWTEPLPELLPDRQRRTRGQVNATRSPESGCALHERFFAEASRRPERLALAYGDDGRLSYGELADRALRVAAFLRLRGVEPGDPVGVTMRRGPDRIAAVLGVLAAGGAYVPTSLDQPTSRRDRIRSNAGVREVLRDLGEPLTTRPLAGPVRVPPEALAYVIYTSGSTGDPKGVEVTHRSAVNTIEDVNERFHVTAADRVLGVSSLDFDLSVYDIFGLLSAGGAVVLISEEDRREARRWAQQVRRWQVTVWNSVPALLGMLLIAAADEPLGPSLRLAMVSGDWVGLELPEHLAKRVPGCRLVALGGATEAAIWSNAFEVAGPLSPDWRSIPYGRPLRNQQYRVVDARGRDCPDWVAGELWIGGVGVARGYRRNAEATARQFLEFEGERWYRTGDIGRYRPDGTLEFLGRADQQVKISGHRIELGEIESALESHPDVARAVAVVTGRRRRALAAFVTPAAPQLEVRALGRFLADLVPPYMMPEDLVELERLPLSPNGKIDRGALARRAERDPAGGEDEPPCGALERALAEAWSHVLGVDTVGRTQSFFALGGDSLSATRLTGILRFRFGLDLSLRQLFASPTVAGLASAIEVERDRRKTGAEEEGAL